MVKKTSIEYRNGHFVMIHDDFDKKGRPIQRVSEIKGTVTDFSVVFTFDANTYVVCSNSLENMYDEVTHTLIGQKPFFNVYTRCKESSTNYYIKSRLAKVAEKEDKAIAEDYTSDLTYNEIMTKARGVFKPCTVKRALECVELCESKARTAHIHALKAEERAKNKEAEAKSVFEAAKKVVNG